MATAEVEVDAAAVVAAGADDGSGSGGEGGDESQRTFGAGTAEVAAATAALVECVESYRSTKAVEAEETGAAGIGFSGRIADMPSLEDVCPSLVDRLLVPAMVFNDYLVRLTSAAVKGRTTDEATGRPLPPQSSSFLRPPAVVALPAKNEGVPPRRCAARLRTGHARADGGRGGRGGSEALRLALRLRLLRLPFRRRYR